jgi:cell division protein FtsI (penicillin-binding protein 3)
MIVVGALCLFAIALAVRYGYLMLSPVDPVPQAPAVVERGPILDRNGRLLAVASPLYHIAVWKPDIPDGFSEADAAELAALLGMSARELEEKISSSDSDYLYLLKRASADCAKTLRAGREKGRFKGIVVEEQDGRTYPMGDMAAHAIGCVGDDNRGLSGVEYAFDDELSPKAPAKARTVMGNQVILTIDSAVQTALERIAKDIRKENQAEAVMFLAMDPRSGDMLGYASEPGFDPNNVREAEPEDLFNMPIGYSYEPGSVFKVFSLSGIMQLGGIDENSTFFCDGAYHHDEPGAESVTIKCMGAHGTVNPQKILSLSCNSGAGYASDTVSMIDFYSMVKAYGFGERTGVGLSGEENGYIRPAESWSLRSKPTIAMGQESLVTAMQMIQAASVLAHRGVLMKPRLVSSVVSPDGKTLWDNPSVPVRQVLDESAARKVLGFMETAVAEGGTATRARVGGVRMAVKTGTAQMVEKGEREYSKTAFIASCLAILPADEPELVLYIAIIKPKGDSYLGGRIAAPPVAKAADELVNLLGIGREGIESIGHSGAVSIQGAKKAEIGPTMPDLTGLPKRLLLPLLSREDISVTIRGDGYVVRQSPAPGTRIETGASIRLELE